MHKHKKNLTIKYIVILEKFKKKNYFLEKNNINLSTCIKNSLKRTTGLFRSFTASTALSWLRR